MERIAWILGDTCIYWSAVIRTLAAAAAICLFLRLYLPEGRKALTCAVFVPLAAAASLVLSRLACWYFRPEGWESLEAALLGQGSGGFALMGAFGGCLAAAGLVRLLGLTRDLPVLADCLSLAGCAGIALGRLASFFNASDRGMVLMGGRGLPWADVIINPVSGMEELRLATFLLQSMGCGLIFLFLLGMHLWERTREDRRRGDIFLLFLLLYGSLQVVLDSTRYDALYLRSNGFVRAVQVLGAGGIALAVLIFAVRLVRAGGWKAWHFPLWTVQAGCFGLAGYMEYYVQRHGNRAACAYGIMAAALALLAALTLLSRCLARAEKRAHEAWLQQLRQEILPK